ncbi:MAG: zf-HC2 domain-containing protein [Lachnospiraceae bacterium]|nr:zf-HC2 domain-containing protein [Lachnospiraceae bacterium]
MDVKQCKIVQDLMPLYLDDVVQEETKQFVEKHIRECKVCEEELEMMKRVRNSELELPEVIDDGKMIKAFRKKIKKKQIIISLVSVVIAVLMTYVGLKIHVEQTRPDINGNEIILSCSTKPDGTPVDVLQNESSGLVIDKDMKEGYISLRVNNKKMEKCHVRLLKGERVLDDTYIEISPARYVTYHMEQIENMEKGLYQFEFYDTEDTINQYIWIEIR